MMNCQTYVFKLSSGQLDEAPASERLWAAQHRLVCRHCRNFTANQAKLQDVVSAYREQGFQPDPPSQP
ncbi:MAG: hypothetical protein RLZZ182_244 [Pseudomonadota bacterium]|jgi:hypothetical protein